MYYKECAFCGCNLDPEEKCDCQDKKKKREELIRSFLIRQSDGQLKINICFKLHHLFIGYVEWFVLVASFSDLSYTLNTSTATLSIYERRYIAWILIGTLN